MPSLSNAVFDAALAVITSSDEVEVQNASSAALINAVVLDAGNFGSIGDYASGGREVECLSSSAGDMQNISVGTGGAATKVVLKDTSVLVAEADITGAPVSLGSSDQVNLGTFNVILADPT